jgi:hypothetical protein
MQPRPPQLDFTFPHSWSAEVLAAPPLIAPARSFTYPRPVAGEEDALARGALRLLIRPSAVRTPTDHHAAASPFLATCALGFDSPALPTGLWSCPHPDQLCAVAGGYAYLINTLSPDPASSIHLELRPVVAIRAVLSHGLLVFAGFHSLLAFDRDGIAWQTPRLSWEGLALGPIDGDTLHGTAWNLPADKEVPFTVDLRTGEHTGGAAPA